MTGRFEIVRVAERALLVRSLDPTLARAVERTLALACRLPPLAPGEERTAGVANLLIRWSAPNERMYEAAVANVRRAAAAIAEGDAPEASGPPAGRSHAVEVEYGGDAGPDLEAVARETGRSVEEVVALHAGAEYTVACLGFAPGFPYLVGLPAALEVPRLASPRPRVPAGSVAIAGPFAGIYPGDSPGGWRLLGRCGLRLFDPGAFPPALFQVGDRVRFVPREISR